MKKNKAIFLDRDGTIIEDAIYLNDPKKIKYLDGAIEGMRMMRDMGYKFIVVTNQSGIARGIVQIENLHAIHKQMSFDLAQHGIEVLNYYYAPYSTTSNHWLRKPNPGMLELGVRDFNLDAKECWMIGDRETDIIAGEKMEMKTIFIEGTEIPTRPDLKSAKNLINAANLISLSF